MLGQRIRREWVTLLDWADAGDVVRANGSKLYK